eukprot:750173-Hanusia_phi.AAC.4
MAATCIVASPRGSRSGLPAPILSSSLLPSLLTSQFLLPPPSVTRILSLLHPLADTKLPENSRALLICYFDRRAGRSVGHRW